MRTNKRWRERPDYWNGDSVLKRMKRISIFVISVLFAYLLWPNHVRSAGGYAGVHVEANSAGASSTLTTSAITTTGSSELIACVASGVNVSSVSDSKSNTWTALTQRGTSGITVIKCYYAENPTVGASHTFTATISAPDFPGMAVIGVTGTATSSSLRGENGGATLGAAVNLTPGSISPGATDIAVSAMTLTGTVTSLAIDSGFTISGTASYIAGNSYGISMAYKTSPSGTESPQWSWGNFITSAGENAAFKQATATSTCRGGMSLLGVGGC